MQNYVIELKAEASGSFRSQKAADSLDIDINKKLTHRLEIKNIQIPKDYSIAMIIGASGSGKTTLAKDLFKFEESLNVDYSKPIIDQLPKEMTYDDCSQILAGVGLNSVPCWIKPLGALSNGQKARALMALEFCSDKDISIVDEYTSVVDRNAAKSISLGISKYLRKNKKKAILISCHYDILDWVSPDWVIDCNEQKFYLYGKKKELKLLPLKLKDSRPAKAGSNFQNIII